MVRQGRRHFGYGAGRQATVLFALMLAMSVALAVALGGAAPAGAASDSRKSVRCVAKGDSACGVSISIKGPARPRVVTVDLGRRDLQLASTTTTPASALRSVEISDAEYRDRGSKYRFRLTTTSRHPKRAKLHLGFTDEPAPPGSGSGRTATIILNIGANMKVSIRGGGGGTSNCTTDETVTTFRTTGNDEAHTVGFDSKGSGSCWDEPSWSEFKFTIEDPSYMHNGEGTIRFGQNEKWGSYLSECFPGWKGITCEVRYGSTVYLGLP